MIYGGLSHFHQIVSPNDPLCLPDDLSLSTSPPILAFLWDTYISNASTMSLEIPPFAQTQTITSSVTAIPTQTATHSPTKTPIVSQNIVPNSTMETNSKALDLIIAYIFVGILGIITIILVYCTIMMCRYAQCPYCYFIIRVGAPFLTHLNDCEEHLKRFTPLTTTVTSISLKNNDGPRTSQLVFAQRPGPRLVAPNFVSETHPLAKREKELIGRTRTNTNDEIVVELSTQQIAAP